MHSLAKFPEINIFIVGTISFFYYDMELYSDL